SARPLEQPIRQRRFAVIDVRDDAEVARKLYSHRSGHYAGAAGHGQLGSALSGQFEKGNRPCFELSMRMAGLTGLIPATLNGSNGHSGRYWPPFRTSSGTLLADFRRRVVKATPVT